MVKLNSTNSMVFLVSLVIFLLNILKYNYAWLLEPTMNCANIYNQINFEGKQLSIKHGDIIFDLNELYLDTFLNNWKNVSSSLKIYHGCVLNICKEKYLGGGCIKITGQHVTIEQNHWSSLSCTCAQNCDVDKCSNINFEKSDCTRAFIENGCNTCNGISVTIKTGQQSYIGSYADKGQKIKSLVVKSGCKLIAYDDRDYEGEQEIFENGHVSKYVGKIESYDCRCTSEGLNLTTIKSQKIDRTNAQMIEIPIHVEQIISKMSGNLLNHKGLKAALISSQNGRSTTNAYILLIGMTGSGKSASINFLFGNTDIAEVGETESVTSDINEYRIPILVDELGIQNSELRVIDTPGLGDTRGLEHDAQFLGTFENYLNNHNELRNRIPNVILVFAKFNENRFTGKSANFIKMLKGIDFFSKKLFDKKFSNIVIVLTHYMSETNELVKNPWSRILEFRKAVEDYSFFPKPIVVTVAENKPIEEELPIVNNFYKLPNHELYPENIFKLIQQLTTIGEDPIGQGIIQTSFKYIDKFNITKVTTPLLNTTDKRVQHYLNILTAGNYNVEDTEISKLLTKYFTDSKLKTNFPDTLPYLQRILNVRNIFTKNDIPKTREEILKLFKQIRQTPPTIQMLKMGLNITAPILDITFLTGNCFHSLQDHVLPTSPFQFNMSNYIPSVLGYLIPNELTCQIQNEVTNFWKIHDNRIGYMKYRLSQLGFNEEINIIKMRGNIETRYNTLDQEQLIAIKEFRKFKLILNENIQLNEEFIMRVKSLPEYDIHNYNSIQIWKDFFTKYGTHVVSSTYGGGMIKIILKNKSYIKLDAEKNLLDLLTYIDDLTNGKYNILFQNSENYYSLEFQNGESSTSLLSNLTKSGFLDHVKIIQSWIESLTVKPMMLKTSLKLISISEIAKRINLTQASQITLAANALVTTGLVYTPRPPPTRDPRIVEKERIEKQRLKAEREDARQKMEFERAERAAQQKKQEFERAAEKKRKELENARRLLEEQNRKQRAQLEEIRLQRAEDERRRAEERARLEREIEYNRRREYEKRKKCLKAGTKILMATGLDKPIEEVKRGDYILDQDLMPSRVLATTQWFLGNQYFYGFEENLQFFTKTHLFVGQFRSYYAVSKNDHIQTNPLMEYENLNDMENVFKILKFENNNIFLQNCSLFKDPIVYPENTPVYFIEVDNPSGTYIANGFVSRHDIPDFSLWPRTTEVLVKILSSQKIQIIKEFEYSMELADKLDDLASIVAFNIDLIVYQNQTTPKPNPQLESVDHFEFNEFTFDRFNINVIIENIFETSSFSSFAVSLYAKCGKNLADLFDLQRNPNSTHVSMDLIVRSATDTIYSQLNTNYLIKKYIFGKT